MTSKSKEDRERQLAGVVELKRKIADTEANFEKKLTHLRECLAGAEAVLVVCEQTVAAEDAAEKVEEFLAVAAELDTEGGESPERLQRFEKLSGELHFARRVALNYEARLINVKRMRRLENALGKPPFASWSALASAWLRPARSAA